MAEETNTIRCGTCQNPIVGGCGCAIQTDDRYWKFRNVQSRNIRLQGEKNGTDGLHRCGSCGLVYLGELTSRQGCPLADTHGRVGPEGNSDQPLFLEWPEGFHKTDNEP